MKYTNEELDSLVKEVEKWAKENKQYESDIAKLMYQNENLERENKQLKERINELEKGEE